MSKKIKRFILAWVLICNGQIWAESLKTYFVGEYVLKKSALAGYTGTGVSEHYGIFDIMMENGNVVSVPDLLYPVSSDGRVGIRVLPVSDKDAFGSEYVDKYLKSILYNDPESEKDIFSLIVYHHPELGSARLDRLDEALRLERGMTHTGSYIGLGRTRNSPVDYHNKKWELFDGGAYGYPAHIYTVGLKGVDQEVLNKNILIGLTILSGHNGGPEFPRDYKFDYLRTFNLKEVLDFYRAWIDPTFVRSDVNQALGLELNTPYIKILKTHQGYSTYCNEFLTIAINLGINLVQTEQGYIDVWGENLGRDLFWKAKKIYNDVTKQDLEQDKIGKEEEIPEALLSSFTNPLWKRDLSIGRQSVALYSSEKIKEFGYALAWRPQTTADIIAAFMELYADFTKINIVRSSFALLAFAKEASRRMGLRPDEYYALALKFIQSMIKHDIRYQSTILQQGVVVSKLPAGHLGREMFVTIYFKKVTEGFATILNGKEKMEGAIVALNAKIEELQLELTKIEEKIRAGDESKEINEAKDKIKVKISDAKLSIDVTFAQIALIPRFQKMIEYLKNITQDLIDNPIEMVDKKFINRDTVLMLTKNIKFKKLQNLTISEQAWLSFAVDVSKRNGGKQSLMDEARFIKPAIKFEDQFQNSVKYVQYYSPPSLIHKIALGDYEGANPDLIITAVGTAFDAVEVERK